MKTTNYFYLAISFILIASLTSCEQEKEPELPKVEYGGFWGEIGKDEYYLINSKEFPRMKTTYFDEINYQFQFTDDATGKINSIPYKSHTKLTINLTDALNSKSYSTFETYNNIRDYSKDWIHLYYYKKWDKDENKGVYTTVKEKQSIDINIVDIEYMNLKIPSIIGNMKGYLYNVENPKDSIYIKADFTTQASY